MRVKQLGYIRQLDGIRALAVLLVIGSHWFPGSFPGKYAFGAIGVDIFFVLSGFLITRILLVERFNNEIIPNGNSKLKLIKNFMMRRALRIFPIYYLLLILLIIFRHLFPNPLFQDWKWYFFYLQNILFYMNQAWPGGKLSHLWSLAVEEQFYLVWPWLILFIPKKWISLLIFICFSVGVGFGYSMSILRPGYNADLLTFSCIHAFAAGGSVAYFHVAKQSEFLRMRKFFIIIGNLALIYMLLSFWGFAPFKIDIRTLVSLFVSGFIAFILVHRNGFFPKYIFGNEVMVFLGKISYGLYLFHNFIPLVLNGFLKVLQANEISSVGIQFNPKLYEQTILFYFYSFLILVFIASLSFFLFEKRILKFKSYF